MSDIAIRVENLSKRYRIGLKEEIKDTFVGAIGSVVRNPLKNLRKLQSLVRFGEDDVADVLWALKDVSFEVRHGEVIGVIGRNGAGKSTLLKILSKITHPTSGRIELNGRVASLLEVGTGFHPELTGRENIYLNGTILGMRKKEIDVKLDEIIDFSGIEKFIDTPVKRYSSGMRVRLAFSVAAHLEPEILLIDEVLAVGDFDFQKKSLGKMGEVASSGRTVLFVSHNMIAIEQLCQKVIMLMDGKIIKIGKTKNVVEYYMNQGAQLNDRPIKLLSHDENIQLSGFNIVDKNMNKLLSIRVGDELRFLMKINSKIKVKELLIGIGLNNNSNLRISTLHNGLTGFPLSLSEGENLIECVIPEFYLWEGKYSFDIKIYCNGDPVIFETNFYNFMVQPSNIYKSGKLPSHSWGGVCHLKQHWNANDG